MEITLIVLSLLATGAGAPGPCSLLARADILAVQKAAVVSEKESAADGKTVEIRRCYYETDPNSKSVSLEWTRDRVPDGARRQWDRLFHPERDDHREDAERDEKESARGAASRTAGAGLRHRRRSLLGTEPRERRDLRVRIARLRPGERGGRGNGRGKKGSRHGAREERDRRGDGAEARSDAAVISSGGSVGEIGAI
jgi:hypothetical protein